jgi:hypothetical protein
MFCGVVSLNKNYTTKGKITMKKKLLAGLAVGAMMFGMSTSSMASVIVLDFEGFPHSSYEDPVESYFLYNEGVDEWGMNRAYSSVAAR